MSRHNNPADPPPAASAREERVAKAIARAGLCSRREAEALIAEGRVAVNGAVISSPALDVNARDRIEVDGKPLPQRERTRLFLYYKPVGLVATNADPEGRPTIFAALPATLPRLVSVGRLDINTEGLLLLTNDGGLARVLELPSTGWLRRYRVRAHGRVAPSALAALRGGMTVDGVRYGPIEAALDREQGANVWLTMAIREGKNREMRNVVEALGLKANRLIRVSFGPFQLGEMRDGEIVEVKTRVLREQLGESLAREAGCDFSAATFAREAGEASPARLDRGHRKGQSREPPRGRERDRRDAQPRRSEGERQRPRRRAERVEDERPRRPPERDGGKRFREKDAERAGRRDEQARVKRDRPEKPQGRPRRGHAWRSDDAPLRRHYRGARDSDAPREADGTALPEARARPKRSGLIADRKGRRVLVERFGEKTPGPAEEGRAAPRRPQSHPSHTTASQRSADRPRRKSWSTSPVEGEVGAKRREGGKFKARAANFTSHPAHQGGREQRSDARKRAGKSSQRFGGGPPRHDDGKPPRPFGGKPRQGRPAPRDRPRGKGPRPSRPKPR